MEGRGPVSEPIRVLLVTGHRMVTEGVTRLLDVEPDIEVVGAGPGPDRPESAGSEARYDVAVIDLDQVSSEVGATIERLRRVHPGIPVVGLASSKDPTILSRAAAMDAAAVYLKTRRSDELVSMIRRIAAGDSIASETEAETGAEKETWRDSSEEDMPLDRLTQRERDVLQALSRGLSTAEVAEALGISPLTVQSHVKSILAKLGVHSKIEAVSMGLRLGLVSLRDTGRSPANRREDRRDVARGDK